MSIVLRRRYIRLALHIRIDRPDSVEGRTDNVSNWGLLVVDHLTSTLINSNNIFN